MSGGGAWGRGTGTEPADGPDGAGARAPARGSGAGGRGWARRGGGPRAELGEPSWAGAVTCEPWKERCATPGKLAALCTHSRTLLGGPWVCARTTRWGAGHPSAETGRLDHGVPPSHRAPGFQFGVRKPVPLRRRWGACPGTLEAAPAPRDWAARPLHLAVGRWGSSSRPGGGRGCSGSRGADPSENGDAPGPEWACARLGEDRTS